MSTEDLGRKADRGTLEVEHLLQAAVARLPGLRAALEQLAVRKNWKTEQQSEATREVPFATWATVAGAYADGGLEALYSLRDQHPPFCIGLHENVRSAESVEALLTWWPEAISTPERASGLGWRIAAALNILLSFKPAPEIGERDRAAVRQLAYRLFGLAEEVPQKATALLLLRGVGDEQSLAFVSRADELAGALAHTNRLVVAAIRRRLGSASKGSQARRSEQCEF